MTAAPAARRGGAGETPEGAIPTRHLVRSLIGVRILAVSALLVGALVMQSLSEEILPIAPLAQVAFLIYVLSLVWIALHAAGVDPGVNAALQLAGDLLATALLIHVTGGVWSPFAFLFLITVSVAALVFGLRGALTVAGAAFVLYGAMVVATLHGLLRSQPSLAIRDAQPTNLGFQMAVTGAGFALVALLTSYLAHSRQRAEAHLRGQREAAARFLAMSGDVVRSVASAVVAADADGKVVLTNPTARRLLGLEESGTGRPLAEVMPLEGTSWPDLLRQIHSGPDEQHRLEAVHVATGIPLGLVFTRLLSEDGQPLGLVAHFQDLTEARENARRERLRERMVAVGQMSAGIAHEIRNPMASISGAAQVLAKTSDLDPTHERLLRIIVEESRRLSRIVEEFLDYARPPQPQPASCDVAAILEETLTLFSHSPEVTGTHRLETAVEPCPLRVHADEGQLRQAFFNLARNAIQAMPDGGRLQVEGRVDGGRYVMRFVDDGVGMTAAQVEEIFQPFKAFRTGGTGLGLAVVYSVVTDHGGEIEVDSTPGHGTVFTVSIPLEAA